MTAYVFINTCVTKSVGIGHPRVGYFRLSFNPIARWRKCGEWYHNWRITPNVDNGGRNWTPLKGWGQVWNYSLYRGVAYHVCIGPFTASYVIDREGYGPIGPVWPRDARKRAEVTA